MNHVVKDGIFGAYKLVKEYTPYKSPNTVGDVMTRAVVTMSPEDTFDKAVELLATRDFRHVVIADDKQKVVGVISDRDILSARGYISEWRVRQLRQIMHANPITTTAETLLSIAVSTMLSKRINCLPVVLDNGKLGGIITSTDIMRSYQNVLELDAPGLRP